MGFEKSGPKAGDGVCEVCTTPFVAVKRCRASGILHCTTRDCREAAGVNVHGTGARKRQRAEAPAAAPAAAAAAPAASAAPAATADAMGAALAAAAAASAAPLPSLLGASEADARALQASCSLAW